MWLADLFKGSADRRFFDILLRHAALLASATQTLRAYVESGESDLADAVANLEKQGDQLIQELIAAIRDTFVTPLDRQDLYNLGETIDDMLDYVNSAASEIKLFCVAATPAMRARGDVLVEAARCIEAAVKAPPDKPAEAYASARAAADAENRMEDLYRSALAELFSGDDLKEMLKIREIYRHLSNSADRAE